MGDNTKKKYTIILLCIIAVQCIYMSVLFATQKQGFHSDELWNYGFANSSDCTHIYKENIGNELRNTDSWQSAQLLRDYITVDKSEIFAYDSIYWNAERDYNPPLGYMMLHFICSFFPGKWSKWYCFVLNILCFLVTQIYLYRTVTEINNEKEAGIFACLFYGFTMGAVNINIFLRIYAPGVMFGMMLLYYAARLYNKRNDKTEHRRILIKMFAVNFLGCMTLHLFLPFAFIITLMYCLYYLFTKRFKFMVRYGATMAASVALSFAVFPATVKHVFGDDDIYSSMSYMTKMFPEKFQYKMYWEYLTNDLFGVHFSMWETMTMTYVSVAILILVLISVPVCFLLRNQEKFKGIVKETANKFKTFLHKINNFNYTLVVLLATTIFVVFVASRTTSTYAMGRYCTRYIFILYPLLAAFVVSVVSFVLSWIIRKKYVRYVISIIMCIVFSVLSMCMAPKDYYFHHKEEGTTLKDIEADSNCIIVTNEPWLLTCFTCEIFDAGNYFLADYESALKDEYNSDKINTDAPLYLILDVSSMDGNNKILSILGVNVIDDRNYTKEYYSDDYMNYFKNIDIATKADYVGVDEIFGRPFKIYRLN